MKRIKRNLGFTILELVIAIGLLGVIGIGTGLYISNSFKDSNKLGTKVEVQSSVTSLMNKLETVIKTSDIPVFNNAVEGEVIVNSSFEINQIKQGVISPVKFEYTDKKVVSDGIEYAYIEEIQILPYRNGAKIKIIGEENKYNLTSTFYTRNTIGTQEISVQNGSNVMLAPGSSWYNEDKINKSYIEKIIFEDKYTPSGTEIAQWEADVDFSGDVMCYVTDDYELIISGRGLGRIYANEDSSYAFGEFDEVTSIEGIEILNTSNVTNMSNMFYNVDALTTLELISFDTNRVTNMDEIFGNTNFDQITLGTRFDFAGANHGLAEKWYLSDGTQVDIELYQSSVMRATTYYATSPIRSCIVNHYLENANNTGYSLYESIKLEDVIEDTIILADQKIAIANSAYKEGKVGNTVKETASILEAHNEQINLYYTRNTYTLILQNNGLIASEIDYKYGANVQINANVSDDYIWSGWYYLDNSLYSVDQSTVLTMPAQAVTLNAVSAMPMGPTIFAAQDSWYKGTTDKATIQQIEILTSYEPTGTVTENWNADINNSGSIKCYIEGTTLKIAGNGDTIYANEIAANMFNGFSSLKSISGLSNIDTRNVTSMSNMFYGCSSLNELDVSNFDTSAVTDMSWMFGKCNSLSELDVSNFDTSKVTDMSLMFLQCSSLTSLDVSNFDTSAVTHMNLMFDECSSLSNLDLSNFDTSAVKNMQDMFFGCSSLRSIKVNSFDTSNVTDMSFMFNECSSLTSLDVSSFDTSVVTNMEGMFQLCSSLVSLDVSNFDTSNVTSMMRMFNGCSSLINLNVSKFDTSNVTSMNHMFAECSSLTSLDISNFDTRAVTDMMYIFDEMNKLQQITLGTKFDFRDSIGWLPTPSSSYITGADGNWYTEDGTALTPAQVASATRTEPTTYYAVQSVQYTLTYNANGGSGAPAAQTGTTLTISTAPTRSGWNFIGWGTSSSDISATYMPGDSITLTKNTTLYAVWRKTITLTYNANGGRNAPGEQIFKGQSESRVFTISTSEPTPPSGKAFRGWSTSSSATEVNYKIGADIRISSDTTLYAVYATPLSVGASFSGVDVGAYVTYTPSNTSYTVPGTMSGYTVDEQPADQTFYPSSYDNWRVYRKVGDGVEVISDESVGTLTLQGSTGYINAVQTLQDISAAYVNSTYAISARSLGYKEDNVSDITNYKVINTDIYPLSYGVSSEFPYSERYYFSAEIGYDSLSDDGASVWIASRELWNYSTYSSFCVRRMEKTPGNVGDVSLYRVYEIGNKNESASGYAGVRPIVTLKSGLKVASGDGSPNNPYTIGYTLTYDANGGSGAPEAQTGATIIIDSTEPTRSGYTFLGWSTRSSATSATYGVEDSITITEDMTLYAVWRGNIEAPTLAASNSWYKGTTASDTITQIDIVSSYTPEGTPTESWNADVDNTGSIKCYVEGTKLTIAGNGAEKIKANTDSSYMFYAYGGNGFSQVLSINGLSLLDTSAVTNMACMFNGCSSLISLDVSKFDTSAVTNMAFMFVRCSSLTSLDLSSFDTSAVTNMGGMFDECSGLTNLDVSKFDTKAVIHMYSMFEECSGLTSLDISNFDTTNVTDMSWMFWYCINLTSLDINNFDTTAVTDMEGMFGYCRNLASLDISNFDTSAVTSMRCMFNECSGLISLDLSSFDTSVVTDMHSMFDKCSGLTSLDVSKFDTSAVADMGSMFDECSGLTNLDLSNFNTSSVTNMSWMFYGTDLETITLGGDFKFVGTDYDLASTWYLDGCTEVDIKSYQESVSTVTTYYSDISHSFSSAVTTQPTCTATGIRTYRCSKCGDSYTKVIASLGHSYSSVVTQPTCIQKGYTTYTCSNCGDSYKNSETVAKGHSYSSVITTEATCASSGVRTYTCSNCSDSYTETIAALGHSYSSVVTTEATCASSGVREYTCSRCNDSYTETIATLGHSYSSVVTTEATCASSGVRTYTCSECNSSYTETIAATLNHNFTTGGTCTVCGILCNHNYLGGTCIHCGTGESVKEQIKQ